MQHIIVSDSGQAVVKSIKEYVQKFGMLRGLHVVDSSEHQLVILLDHERPINEERAEMWWSGYTAALGA